MTYRQIEGLRWARPCHRPASIPLSKPKGAKAQGLRYERLAAKALPSASHGQWYEYEDSHGHGFCQPDIMFIGAAGVVVIECKLTWTPIAIGQLSQLYVPILREAHQRDVFPVIMTPKLTRQTPPASVFPSLHEALASGHPLPVVHWLGKSPLA